MNFQYRLVFSYLWKVKIFCVNTYSYNQILIFEEQLRMSNMDFSIWYWPGVDGKKFDTWNEKITSSFKYIQYYIGNSTSAVEGISACRATVAITISFVDPHHVDADPDSNYQPDADPDSDIHLIRMRTRIRIRLFTLMRIWIRILASK